MTSPRSRVAAALAGFAGLILGMAVTVVLQGHLRASGDSASAEASPDRRSLGGGWSAGPP